MECLFVTHMAVSFVDRVVPDSEDDTPGIYSALFGLDILHFLGIGTFILDIAVGDTRSTPQLLTWIHSDSNKPVAVCLRRETPITSFYAVSTHRSAVSVPLYITDDSTDDS